ncbi:uncharacterized protein LOC123499989 isoform X2 [Portunus trituberculatus]|uniref:uncharacterized protein LOC123499989 isoform X2 n=1 Tax=Portunus trituberculatus TaxID=210409 RepID=UPI001E1D0C60|nr:uncharacterized protein LOC123499989 isoform X2 [Portunus trituberculatus]
MGCRYSKATGCYSLTCCFCVDADEACWWIGAVGVVWGAVAVLLDFISAHLPEQPCKGCLDYTVNTRLSLASGSISAAQWVASILLLHGARKENKWLLVPWLACSVVSLAMLVAWVAVTLPRTPSLRSMVSLVQLALGIHFFIVVTTHYRRLALKFVPPEDPPLVVPPNTPAKRHKLRRRRLDPGCQPAIRVLLGAALRLRGDLQRGAPQDEEDESEYEEEDGIEMRVIGASDVREARDEEESFRRRRRTMVHKGGIAEGDETGHLPGRNGGASHHSAHFGASGTGQAGGAQHTTPRRG